MSENVPAHAAESLKQSFSFTDPALFLGAALLDGQPDPKAGIRLPLRMLNRHGLIAGATGTGKTVTLQVIAEQLSTAGIPAFLADIKGDLGGLAQAAKQSEKLTARLSSIGVQFEARANPVQFLSLAGSGNGAPIRASLDSFGPILLSRVMELNDTQEQCLQLVFHFANQRDLPLDDLKDLKAVIAHLLSDEGEADLRELGGLPASTAGVLLRGVTMLQAQGLEQFFGQPEFDVHDLISLTDDGLGVLNILEVDSLRSKPLVFSTFMIWLLAELFEELPEAGDLEKPKLVFFIDEAHLVFENASKAFMDAITSTVRLIRSKSVGLFFISQSSSDIPQEVLGQLGHRIQHAVRVFTPKDAQDLKAVVSTFPTGPLDLSRALREASVGEAVISVLDPRGVPTPSALTRLSSPGSRIGVPDAGLKAELIASSALTARYAAVQDRDSAHELLSGTRVTPASPTAPLESEPAAPNGSGGAGSIDEEAQRIAESILGRRVSIPPAGEIPNDAHSAPERAGNTTEQRPRPPAQGKPQEQGNPIMDFAMDAANTLGRELLRGMFGTRRRRRRRW
ncbi:helicase HerA-like domain-containing protein [Glutamicibacter endophyticus]|uniref:helicase HerA-like domain-containing protein n=1 Tax=Glutamicibacter endophyticus TaxID=1522174 RepID=UPI003AF057DD